MSGRINVERETYRTKNGLVVYCQANITYEVASEGYEFLLGRHGILVILWRGDLGLLGHHALLEVVVKLPFRFGVPQQAGLLRGGVVVDTTMPPRMAVLVPEGVVLV